MCLFKDVPSIAIEHGLSIMFDQFSSFIYVADHQFMPDGFINGIVFRKPFPGL